MQEKIDEEYIKRNKKHEIGDAFEMEVCGEMVYFWCCGVYISYENMVCHRYKKADKWLRPLSEPFTPPKDVKKLKPIKNIKSFINEKHTTF